MVIADEDEFTKVNLKKAGYPVDASPLDDPSLNDRFRVVRVPLSSMVREKLSENRPGCQGNRSMSQHVCAGHGVLAV